MSAHRTAARAAFAGITLLAVSAVAAEPAAAHGAPTDPVSRVYACSPEGKQLARSAACKAAIAANGGASFEQWDNLRVADVRGRDRRLIPNGRLCSAGIDAYKGLDVARADWPATTLKAGSEITLTYASTIPHKGTFSLYLTKDGYDPAKPLSWGDLDRKPFATATDPALRNGAYRIEGRLPADRTGHHMLYTVWRNTDTPDTYYSCSDVVLTSGDKNTDKSGGGQAAKAPAKVPASDGPRQRTAPSAQPDQSSPSQQPTAVASHPHEGITIALAAAAATLIALCGVGAFLYRRRHRR